MELLNYTIPPFKTVAWVSDNAKTIWDNRFKIINDALIQSTFKALKEDKLTSQYLIVEGWQYFKILELAATLNISVDALFLGDKNVKGPVYYQLLLTTKEVNLKDATPNCCLNCSNAVRADKRKEFYWNAAIQSNLHTIDHQEITLPATTYTSIFWQKLLVTLGNQHCCNLECENYKNQQDKSLELLTHYNYNNAQLWLKDIYSWPVAWSASHGICELRTPIVKMAYDTDATATNYVIKIEGDSYPKEGAPGNQFPYRKRNFLRISDSKSFKAGLEHGS